MFSFNLPGMKLHWCRWKLSREEDPQPHLRTSRALSPFCDFDPIFVYSWTPGESWMQGKCFCCTSHTRAMLSWFMRRKPVVSVSSHIESSSFWIRLRVSSTPRVFRRQCLASSLLLMLDNTWVSVGTWPWCFFLSSDLLASLRCPTSSLSHSKMQLDNFEQNVPYSGWCSVVRPLVNRLIKWKMSSLTVDFHGRNKVRTGPTPVQLNNTPHH